MINQDKLASQDCPSRQEWTEFLLGNMPMQQVEEYGSHLENCQSCERQVQELHEETDHLFQQIRISVANEIDDTYFNEPECNRLLKLSIHQVPTRSFDTDDVSSDSISSSIKPSSNKNDSIVPDSIGKYIVLELVAEGGFGQVYRARHPELSMDLAIKVPRADRYCFQTEDDFLHEANTLAKLSHRNIVTIHDAGRDDQCGVFIAMKWIDGLNLKEYAANNQLDFHQSAELVATVAEALQFAHKQRFYHRDLKPGNILIDAGGTPYVTDFGLAINESEQASVAGQYAGSEPYMSPEQILRKPDLIDGRSDIWSLGVIFYELLLGERPFSRNRGDLRKQIVDGDARPLRQVNESIPKYYEEICLDCLKPSPADRIPTAGDLATRLRERKSYRPIRRFSRRDWIAVAGLAIVLSGGAFAAGQFLWKKENPVAKSKLIDPWKDYQFEKSDPEKAIVWPEGSICEELENGYRIDAPKGKHCYFPLGNINQETKRFSVEISQEYWVGDFGIYFGRMGTRAERILFSQSGTRVEGKLELIRSQVMIHRGIVDFDMGEFERITHQLAPLKSPFRKIQIDFSRGFVTGFQFEGQQYAGIVNGQTPRNSEGEIGIFVYGGSVLVRFINFEGD